MSTPFNAGDLVAIPLLEGACACGRVMLDVKTECLDTGLLWLNNPLLFFEPAILVEVYAEVHPRPTAARSGMLIPGIFVSRHAVEGGRWPVVGHQPVRPEEVDFPEFINSDRKGRATFQKGEVRLRIHDPEVSPYEVKCHPCWFSAGIVEEMILFLLGRYAELPDPQVRDEAILSLRSNDLRFRPPDEHKRFLDLVGLETDEQYDQLSLVLNSDHDLARFYTPESLEGKPPREEED